MKMNMDAGWYVEQSLRQFAGMNEDEQRTTIEQLTGIVQAAADAGLVDAIAKSERCETRPNGVYVGREMET